MRAVITKRLRIFALMTMTIVVSSCFHSARAADEVKGKFAWGAEAGGSIDMSANDMSSIDLTASFGFSRGWIKFVGIGTGVDIMLNNSCRSFPTYISFKTDFSNRPSLLFMDIRGGFSINYLPDDKPQTGAYGFGGIGINLARGKKFTSHIVIGYTLKQRKDFLSDEGRTVRTKDLHLATVRLGIIF